MVLDEAQREGGGGRSCDAAAAAGGGAEESLGAPQRRRVARAEPLERVRGCSVRSSDHGHFCFYL